MKITGNPKNTFLTIEGKRMGIWVSKGPWNAKIGGNIHPDQIKIRPKSGVFPDAVKALFVVENNSDGITDYYEPDCIRILPGHVLYDMAKAIE